jgi:hypothetical protein
MYAIIGIYFYIFPAVTTSYIKFLISLTGGFINLLDSSCILSKQEKSLITEAI